MLPDYFTTAFSVRKSALFIPVLFSLSLFSWQCRQAAGHAAAADQRNMTEILAEIRARADSPDNMFNSAGRIAFCDSVLAVDRDPVRQIEMLYRKANAQLEFGDENAAVKTFEELVIKVGNDPKGRPTALAGLGIAYLRLAERTNCVNQHMSDACIMPIRGNGIHRDKTAGRKAAEIYETLLELNPEDWDARWLLNLTYMTLGEYPAKVPPKWLIAGLDNPGEVAVKPFLDIATGLNISTNNRSGGSIVDDFDNDGYLDVVSSAWGLDDPMHYFHNNGDGTFSDWSQKSGLSAVVGGLNLTSTDYNNDGRLDIFVLRGGWQGQPGYTFGEQPKSLLRNNADGTFTDVTIEAGLLSFHPTQTATWNDFNNDGWLDVFIGHEHMEKNAVHPCQLYLNDGKGHFDEIAASAGVNITAFVKGTTSGDYDNDGWADILLSTMDGKKILLHNKGSGKKPAFEDVSAKAGFAREQTRTFGTWFFDYNNDGWLDLAFCNYDFEKPLSYYAGKESVRPSNEPNGKVLIYRNNQDGTFSNVSSRVGMSQFAFAMGVNFGDIDNDGWLDFYLGTGNPNFRSLVPNRLYKNLGGEKFADVTNAARVGHLQKGHGIAFADIDNDGDQDIYADMGGAFRGDAYYSSLYLNPGQTPNNWISLKLEGVASNKAAIGAKITVKFRENGQPRQAYREVNTGASFGCSPLRREIGVGQAGVIDEIVIRWPATGKQQVLRNVTPNQFLRLREGQDQADAWALRPLDFSTAINNMPMCAQPAAK